MTAWDLFSEPLDKKIAPERIWRVESLLVVWWRNFLHLERLTGHFGVELFTTFRAIDKLSIFATGVDVASKFECNFRAAFWTKRNVIVFPRVHLQISELDALLFDDLHFHRLEVHANGDACLHHCSEAILGSESCLDYCERSLVLSVQVKRVATFVVLVPEFRFLES